MGRPMKKQGPKQLARVADNLDSPRVQRYLIQRGRFSAYLTTPHPSVVAMFERRGYSVTALEMDGER